MKAEVIQGDCLEVMKSLPDSSVDLICTDPPYYKVKGEEWDRQWKTPALFLEWLSAVAAEWQRLLKPNGSLYCFASPAMAARVEVALSSYFDILNSITWAKPDPFSEINRGAGNGGRISKESLRSYYPNTERIIFAQQYGDEYADADRRLHIEVYSQVGRRLTEMREAAGLERWEVDVACAPSRKPTGLCYRWESGDCLPSREQYEAMAALCRAIPDYESLRADYEALREPFEALREPFEALRRPFFATPGTAYTDVWTFPTVATYPGKHVCEKPIAMLRHIITTSTRKGAVVLDSFAGSGATGEAALALGRSAILIEKSPEWCERVHERLTPKPDLFTVAA